MTLAKNEKENSDFSLEKLFPMPESENKDNWYEWNTSNWGTKWDLSDVNVSGRIPNSEEVSVSFSSAWSPPIEALVNIS